MTTPPPPHVAPPQARGPAPASDPDEQHLRVLSILFYVMGGLNALMGCAGLLWLIIGIGLVVSGEPLTRGGPEGSTEAVQGIGGLAIVLGVFLVGLALVTAAAVIYAGRCLATQQNRIYCFVIACFMCLSVPLGTLLGVFTIVVLSRASVIAKFNHAAPATIR